MTARTPSQRVLDRSVGENLDRLITVDARGDGICRVIYDAARALTDEPLTLTAARLLVDHVAPGDRVLILTGFLIPPGDVPETDGPIGSAVLAHALVRALRAVPVFACEPQAFAVVDAALRGAGLAVVDDVATAEERGNTAALVPFPRDAADPAALAAALAQDIRPAVCVAVERPGANRQGQYHFAGGANVTASIARVDALFAEVARRGSRTVAIGDFGNELGMGAIADAVRAETPAGGSCGCGCGGGTANEASADATVACTVSDWGAYALAAAVGHLTDRPEALPTTETYRRVAEAACAAGAIDGTSRLAVPDIDGVPAAYHLRLFDQLRDVVALPRRPYLDNAGRAFRAGRYFPETSE
ncbi:protein of unknown function [Micromonospora pallida]|uniref:D-glutamate cyclase-like C-terminal domain-containing protein n=1 Tax=Micromonospora pallida TaxID=145854 RepID=A0A1C6SFG4_9ACTN|nr:glutamate cyclase domain-containing protein [Micromonospora pallida]SCL28204.1 protein of unknown function [Micromonospora pallida]